MKFCITINKTLEVVKILVHVLIKEVFPKVSTLVCIEIILLRKDILMSS